MTGMLDFRYFVRRALHEMRDRVVRLRPKGATRGAVLISYTTLPYLDKRPEVLSAHTNRWECMQMAREFLNHGYAVDIIDSTDTRFVPKKKYAYFVDIGTNMERVASYLNTDCIKIFFNTHSHWRFQNEAERIRLLDIKKRRGIELPPVRELKPERAIELCDVAASVGNEYTVSTYAYTGKPITLIPLSTTHTYPSPDQKNFGKIRKNFIWFGGAGLAHKGLDLVLEAFASMPEYHLTVCGKVSPNDPFVRVYAHELYELPNIKTLGWIDPGSQRFKDVCEKSLGIIYPSCAEGCAGSVVLCMHAGLIPIVSRETGVDVTPFGIQLEKSTVETISHAVQELANVPASVLRERAIASWEYARNHHTREKFASAFRDFVDMLEKKQYEQ